MDKTIKSTSISFGVNLGIILTVLTVLAYAFSLELFTKWWFGILSFLILLVISILSVRAAKKAYPGLFTFKLAFTSYFLTILIGTFISTIASILIFNFIDPEAANTVKELTVDATREMLEKFGTPESEINKAISQMEEDDQFSIVNQLKRYVFSLAFLSLAGLIIALIFKEKDPNN
jgi:uncharacterized membrane protein